ncbi:hypothetical protein Dvina_22130 [Dactylosporangium vinaceum]|uniref:Uncharacterized protein n=1 Tax=Dactylosporangium vinaceum TaxID=53362 RepID=A0ABV5MR93_9ACTN|nr:hypothetical protein [Dactylosporangium vinaceum]UAC00510.1 hypothetical protein Dvina_22130 [Dactylosporangium vinaceum]
MEPLPLPPCEPGGQDLQAVAESVVAWARSEAMAGLVGEFGGVAGGDLDELAEFSKVWDYRAGVKERFDTERVDFEPERDARVRALMHGIGMGGAARPAHRRYDHILVLGGGIRVALGRTDYTARLLAGGLGRGSLTGLGSLRHRDDREFREGARLGLGPVETEADMMAEAFKRSLGLGEPTGTGQYIRSWEHDIRVLAAPSTRPGRRANTADTLTGWAELVHTPSTEDRLLLVTNSPYVRHQHCDAIRLLGHRYGCGVETIGYDEAADAAWGRALSTTELLQEVRSSILAMRNLYAFTQDSASTTVR